MHNFKKWQYEGLDRFLLTNYITLIIYFRFNSITQNFEKGNYNAKLDQKS